MGSGSVSLGDCKGKTWPLAGFGKSSKAVLTFPYIVMLSERRLSGKNRLIDAHSSRFR